MVNSKLIAKKARVTTFCYTKKINTCYSSYVLYDEVTKVRARKYKSAQLQLTNTKRVNSHVKRSYTKLQKCKEIAKFTSSHDSQVCDYTVFLQVQRLLPHYSATTNLNQNFLPLFLQPLKT